MSSEPELNAESSTPAPEAVAPVAPVTEEHPALVEAAHLRAALMATSEAAAPSQPQAEGEKPVVSDGGLLGQLPPSEIKIPEAPELGDLEAEIAAAMQADVVKAETAKKLKAEKPDIPSENQRINNAVVQSIHADDVFVDIGFRLPGVVALKQFEGLEPPTVGQQLAVIVRKIDENEGLIAVSLPKAKHKGSGNWDTIEEGQLVDCTVTKTNKGGLEVTIGNLRGFLPSGQVELGFNPNLESYVGQKIAVRIIEANKQKRNLVVSRKQVLQDERRETEAAFWEKLVENQQYVGTVKTLKEYGAFIDLGGVDGFCHIGQMSWQHIRHPSQILKEGQEVSVIVTKLDRESKKITLSMKALSQNPWALAEEKYAPGSQVRGKVTRVTEFGAFVELEPNIEGMIHISELEHRRVKQVTDVVQVDQEVDVKVLDFDGHKKRIALSIKALKAAPESEKKAEDEAIPAPVVKRVPRGALKGGTGTPAQKGGGLFGNPNDFR